MRNDGFYTPEPDDQEVRTAAYLAAGPSGKSEVEHQCVVLCQQMVERLDNISRLIAECNVVFARTNDRMIRFLHSESPLEALDLAGANGCG